VRQRILRVSDDEFAIDLGDDERELLVNLAGQLRDLLLESDRPEVQRLFPPGYANDPEREAEYRAMVRDDLLEQRFAAIDLLESTAQATELDLAQMEAWMGSVNSLRLVLGTILDVSEDMVDLDPEDPNAPSYYVYGYLSSLLGEMVEAFSDGGRSRRRRRR
jgi:hypothetical protein